MASNLIANYMLHSVTNSIIALSQVLLVSRKTHVRAAFCCAATALWSFMSFMSFVSLMPLMPLMPLLSLLPLLPLLPLLVIVSCTNLARPRTRPLPLGWRPSLLGLKERSSFRTSPSSAWHSKCHVAFQDKHLAFTIFFTCNKKAFFSKGERLVGSKIQKLKSLLRSYYMHTHKRVVKGVSGNCRSLI